MEIEITKVTTEDIPVIETMAGIVFRHTYRNILTKEQIEYMMEWMYSEVSLERQLLDGHEFFIAWQGNTPCGYMSIQKERVTVDSVTIYLSFK